MPKCHVKSMWETPISGGKNGRRHLVVFYKYKCNCIADVSTDKKDNKTHTAIVRLHQNTRGSNVDVQCKCHEVSSTQRHKWSLPSLSGMPQVTQGDFAKVFENMQAISNGTD